jgi:general secretion pathway protein G
MLRQRLRAVHASDEGFTLIELLIVIVILGVLAGITVFGVSAFKDDGTKAVCQSDKKSVEVAVQAYYAKNKAVYPADVDALVTGGYLKSKPAGITIDATTGAVTATGC